MKIWAIFLFILFLNFVSASCSDEQIDLNSASLSKLDELTGIGPVKAQAIIDTRPFDSIDKLIDVYGIGEITLQKIKDQDLACVEDEGEEDNEEADEDKPEEVEQTFEEGVSSNNEPEIKLEEEVVPIMLNSQTIKSENNNEEKGKSSYAIYGFVGFCVLLVVLFIIKARRNKSELE